MATDAQIMLELFFAVYFALIIDRSQGAYNPYDTYSAWARQSPAHRRLAAALVFLFILPLLQFAFTYLVIGQIPIVFDQMPVGILTILMIGFLSFFSFGYYRIFEAFLNRFPSVFFSEAELLHRHLELRPHFWSHFIPGFLYIGATIALLSVLVVL